MIVKKLVTGHEDAAQAREDAPEDGVMVGGLTAQAVVRLWHLGPVESCPSGTAGLASVDAWLCQPDVAPPFYFDLAPPGMGCGGVVAL
jgi:hypothetical protein